MEDRKHDYGDDGSRDEQENCRRIFKRIMALSQVSYRNMQEVKERVSQEMLAATDRRASLSFSPQVAKDKEGQRQLALNLPVCSPQKRYGTLQVASLDGQPALPAMPHSVAHLLAELCGMVLYTCEITLVVQQLYEQFAPAAREPLTKREAQVLMLMRQRLCDL